MATPEPRAHRKSLKVGEFLSAFLVRRYPKGLLLVIVKVAGVSWPFAFGDEWGLHLKAHTDTITSRQQVVVGACTRPSGDEREATI